MVAPAATRTKVRNRLIDISTTNPQLVDATTLDEAIAGAVSRYSEDRPRATIVKDVTGNGTEFYLLTGGSTVLASWVDGSSSIESIDYPAGTVAVNYTPTWLDPDFDWTYYRNETGLYLRLKSAQPSASQTLRITYSAPHTHTSVTDTVPAPDLDALCDLAAYYACLALGTKAAGSQDSVIAADSTNYRDSQLRYKQQAEMWEKSYFQRMGIDPDGGVVGASATADWNRSNTVGQSWLTHNRRWGR